VAPAGPAQAEVKSHNNVVTLGLVTAILIPFVGFFIGIALIARGDKNGATVTLVSVIAFALYLIAFTHA
jgi:hypothetical protein